MSSRVEYVPLPPPAQSESLPVYIQNELIRISQAVGELSETTLPELNEEPLRPRNGQLAYADGTNWNPGSGRGLYFRKGAIWLFII